MKVGNFFSLIIAAASFTFARLDGTLSALSRLATVSVQNDAKLQARTTSPKSSQGPLRGTVHQQFPSLRPNSSPQSQENRATNSQPSMTQELSTTYNLNSGRKSQQESPQITAQPDSRSPNRGGRSREAASKRQRSPSPRERSFPAQARGKVAAVAPRRHGSPKRQQPYGSDDDPIISDPSRPSSPIVYPPSQPSSSGHLHPLQAVSVPRHFQDNDKHNPHLRGNSPPPEPGPHWFQAQGDYKSNTYRGGGRASTVPDFPGPEKGNRAQVAHSGPSRIKTQTHYSPRGSSTIGVNNPQYRAVTASSQKSIDMSIRTHVGGQHAASVFGQHIKAVGEVKGQGGIIDMTGGGQVYQLANPGDRAAFEFSDPQSQLRTTSHGDASVILAASTKPFGPEPRWEERWKQP